MIADEVAIGVINHKTTAVRIIPVPARLLATAPSSAASLARLPSSPSTPRAARRLSSVTVAASPHSFPAFEIKKTKKPLEEMRKVVTLFAIQTHRTRLHGQHPKHQRRMES
ncbi:MAG: DUF711 family protein [Isosphaeraceae bacterium]